MFWTLFQFQFALIVLLVPIVSKEIKDEYANRLLRGNSILVPNKTIHGAIILSSSLTSHQQSNYHQQISDLRLSNFQFMSQVLPFPLIPWPAVFTHECFSSPTKKKLNVDYPWHIFKYGKTSYFMITMSCLRKQREMFRKAFRIEALGTALPTESMLLSRMAHFSIG
jgi:hypothetical protein